MTTKTPLLFLQDLPVRRAPDLLRRVAAGALLVGLAWMMAVADLRLLALGLGALAVTWLLLRAPWLIWPAIGVLLPFAAAMRLGPVSALEFLVGAGLALWFADGVRRGSLRTRWTTPALLLLVYWAALFLSLFPATDLVEGIREVIKWGEMLLVLLVASAMLTAQQRRWLVVGLLVGGMAQAALGLYQFIFRIGPDWFIILGRFMRASGSFRQPNPFAGYLGLCLPVAVSMALWAWGRWWQPAQPGASLVERVRRLALPLFFSTAAGLIGVGMLASWSRGGWLGAAAGLAVVVALRSRRALLFSGIALLLLAMALLLGAFTPALIPAPVAARLQDLPGMLGLAPGGLEQIVAQPVTDENFSVVERVAHWVAALRMWESAPWLGVGAGNYSAVYPEVRLLLWEEPLGHAHNIYLNVLAESGLVGIFAFAVFWGGVTIWVARCALRTSNGWTHALAVGVLGVFAHLAVHNLFDNLFVQGMVVHLGLWMVALGLCTEVNCLGGTGLQQAKSAAAMPERSVHATLIQE